MDLNCRGCISSTPISPTPEGKGTCRNLKSGKKEVFLDFDVCEYHKKKSCWDHRATSAMDIVYMKPDIKCINTSFDKNMLSMKRFRRYGPVTNLIKGIERYF